VLKITIYMVDNVSKIVLMVIITNLVFVSNVMITVRSVLTIDSVTGVLHALENSIIIKTNVWKHAQRDILKHKMDLIYVYHARMVVQSATILIYVLSARVVI